MIQKWRGGGETFFNYKKFRWMWLNLAFLLLLCSIYAFHSPVGGHYGGTFYGYTLGIIATAAIIYLMWYGMRKRSYYSKKTTLKGWLAAHVWLGLSMLLIVPLHAGFSMEANVHTLAYVLMVIVILSGIWGAVSYQTLAPQIESHRGGGTLKNLVEQFHIFSQNISSLCSAKSDVLLHLRHKVEVEMPSSLPKLIFCAIEEGPEEGEIMKMISSLSEAEREDGLHLIKLSEKKRELAFQIQREIRLSAKLKLWLLFHLPVSFALLVAVAIHIFAVLFYR